MKKKILSILLVMIIIIFAVGTISVSAASGTCGRNLTWTLNGDTLTISGQGGMYDWGYSSQTPWYSVKDDIVKVVIEDSVTSIGVYAFFGCKNLSGIIIPDSVVGIGIYAFLDCSSLEYITVEDNNLYYCSVDGVLFDKNKANLIQYPADKEDTEYIIPKSVINICDYAFLDCTNLKRITIPESVTSFGLRPFGGCSGLENVMVEDNNAYYCSLNGVLFNKNKTTLMLYPATKTDTEYIIPEGVTKIDELSFYSCLNLVSITVPESVTRIGNYAFDGCISFNCVYYKGTKEEWNKISVGLGNEPLKKATLHVYDVQEKYHINEVAIKDMSGNSLQSIPVGTFIATVSFTNVRATEDTVIVLAQYTDAGVFKGLMYIQAEDVPIYSTMKLSVPVDNSSGDIAILKAFCIESFGSLTPMGNSVSFPIQ